MFSSFLRTAILGQLPLLGLLSSVTAAESAPTYNRDIRPILSDKCFLCHGPDPAKREGDLRLDVREEAIKEGAIVPGKPAESKLVKRILHHDPEEVMPPPKAARQLSSTERDLLARWIQNGATYEPHWAFTPLPATIPVPPSAGEWAKDEIDRFIADRLAHEKLFPSPAASRERWLRRVTFDLTGLPATRAEVDGFLADQQEGAKERVVDRLLASPRYGEKMAVGWLDIARYADSFGYQSDLDTQAWPYRDWVIGAFNQNLPWDQFITWQVAGDLLPNPTRDQRVATAFNRIHRKTQEGGSVEAEFRQEGISDRVHTFGTAFLALTFECTRCHDHKYDPLTQRDYYSMGAFFNSIDEWGLLHGIGSIQPSPTLQLTKPDQDKAIETQTQAIAQAEAALTAKQTERESAFQIWLAAPTAPSSDLSGSYDLDALAENKNLANAIDEKKPATTNEHNKLVTGHRGQALSFTGDDALSLGNHGANHREDPVSLAFWLKPGPRSKRAVVFHNSSGYDPGYHGYELLLEDGRLRWMVSREWPGNCIAIRSTPELASGEWVHVTATYDGSSKAAGLKLFLNGQPAEQQIVRDHLVKNSGGGSGFTFGERVRDSGLKEGAVDDIRIFSRAITPLEVEALQQDRALSEIIATTPKDEAGFTKLRTYYFSAIDPDLRKATADLKGLRNALRHTLDGVQELPVMEEMKEERPAFILARGAYDAPEGEPLSRATPAALPPMPADLPRNRLGLAKWLTQPNHPLTARVQVNRTWQHFFGRGLVATEENFGLQGELPSHPELLDWLARDFISHGWDMKRLCRQLVLSATYGQDSRATAELRERDPSNILLARGPVRRLPAEDLRDQALALSGLLQPTIGGPSVKSYLPDAATWRSLNSFLPEYKRDAAPAIYRRSMYSFWRRTAPPPGMLALDAPGREVCTVKRQQTNTPLQPLVTLNDPQFVEASRALAIRMFREGGSDPVTRARWAFRETLDREPEPAEVKLLGELYDSQLASFRDNTQQAEAYLKVGDLVAPADIPPIDLAAATVLANAILNLDEAITLR